jgi:hypothetical protein
MTALLSRKQILARFDVHPNTLTAFPDTTLPRCTPDLLDRLRAVQITGAQHGKMGWYPGGDFSSDADWCYGIGAEIQALETALDIDDGSVFELYTDAHSAFFRDGTINPGERDNYTRNSCYTFHFGAYGETTVSLWAAADHLCDALEIAADWLADNAPGHFSEPDYAGAAADLGLPFDPVNFDYDSEEGQRILEAAEADMTNTERGWLLSWEWSVEENDNAPGPAARK